jgi:hypothetical protein
MQRRGFLITGSIISALGVLLGLAGVSADTDSPRQNRGLSEFPAAVGAHETPVDAETALNWQNATQTPAQPEVEPLQIVRPTRSSFMASWQRVSSAIGYRLDVSTSALFDSYVSGYQDLDVGNTAGRVVTGLSQGTTYYYRVRAYDATGTASANSGVMTATTSASSGLIIKATFDSSITSRTNAATIEAMINRAILIYESLFADPITIQILFRYSTTAPGGTALPQGTASQSDYVIYTIPWSTYINALKTDAKTNNDFLANASLPATALSANIVPSSAGGRAVKLNTPVAMFANGTAGSGGPYDGIVTLNSSVPYQFTRPTSSSNLDAQRAIEHEMGEVLGFGSRLNLGGSNLRPQDLFSWSSAGVRNLSSSGTRYFSINRGTTNIVNFSQDLTGDLGDWLSTACPQAHPYVQNAFGCNGQSSDIAGTSPEGVNLDVIGYNLVNAPITDFNGDGKADWSLYNGSTQQTALWYMNNNVHIGSVTGPLLPAGWRLVTVADFNGDGHPDYLLFNSSTRQTYIWYLNKNGLIGGAAGPTAPAGWSVVGVADFNGDGHPDYLLFNSSTRQTYIWYLNKNGLIGAAAGPTLPAGWSVVAP